MSAADLLNTDVAVLGERLRAGLDWWLGELRQMAGPLLSSSPRASGLVAERRQDGAYLLRRDGQAAGVHAPGDAPLAAALVLPPSAVLVRELAAPPLPDRDVRRMLALDLDRLTPFRPEAVYFALAPVAGAGEDAPRVWRLSAAPRDAADRAVAEAEAAGLQPVAVLAGAEPGALDLLPTMRAGSRRAAGWTPAVRLWLIVVGLLLANVGAAVWRDVRLTDAVQAAVADQQPVAGRVLRLRRRIDAVQAAAQAQIADRDAHEPLRTLATLTQALGDDVWLRRLTLDDGGVRIAGARREGADAAAMLRGSPAFADVRDSGGDPSDPTAFELSARLASPPPAKPR